MSRTGRTAHLLLVVIVMITAHLLLPLAHALDGHHHGPQPAVCAHAEPVKQAAVAAEDDAAPVQLAANLPPADSDAQPSPADLDCACCPGCTGAAIFGDHTPRLLAWGKSRAFILKADRAPLGLFEEALPRPPRSFV